jgi:hypothetical protein
MKVITRFLTFLIVTVLLTSWAFAGDDPSIPASEKDKIKTTMVNYIKRNSTRYGNFLIQDSQTKKTMHLKFDHVHKGVVIHNDGYLSCVDMLMGSAVVDLDFVVSEEEGEYRVSKIAIHKVDGVKRKNHLDH